jgi:hypothetical protein
MNAHVRDCLVTDFEDLIESLTLPDSDDRHVLAAAIRGKADLIVTFNLSDFPADVLAQFQIEAQHPEVDPILWTKNERSFATLLPVFVTGST